MTNLPLLGKSLFPCLLSLVPLLGSRGFAQNQTSSNLEVFRSLARDIVTETARVSGIERHTKVHLIVLPRETAWYVHGAIDGALKTDGFIVGEDAAAPSVLEFALTRGSVRYSDIRRDGFFGGKLVDRQVDLTLTAKVVNRINGMIVLSSDMGKSLTDTIAVADIGTVENPAIPMTVGRLPSEGFFSYVAEPLIAIGAIAVAILLLFNVRS